MAYWLVKSEPSAFSWADQVKAKVEPWNGVRNHQANKNLKTMARGDRCFFYHSVEEKQIVGVVEVVRTWHPDPRAPDTPWGCVDMKAVGPVKRPVTLADIKAHPKLTDLALVRQSRLSVVPVSAAHWKILAQLAGWKD